MARRRKRKSLLTRLLGFFLRVLLLVLLVCLGLYAARRAGILQESEPESIRPEAPAVSEVPKEQPEAVTEALPGNEAYYYKFLTEDEQAVYRIILQACENYDFEPELRGGTDEDTMYHAVIAFTEDYPQYYWVNSAYTYYRNAFGRIVSLSFPSNGTERETLARIEQTADAVLADCPGSPYEAYKYLYDWIIDTADYDEAAPNGQNLNGVILDHRAVCAGYSKAYQYLCERAGLFCTTVSGTAVMKDGSYGSHAWNLIRIGDRYYWADTTWGDPMFEGSEAPGKNYNYFCVSDRVINAEHRVETALRNNEERTPLNVGYPTCDDDSLDWYVLNGSYFETYDPEAVRQYILRTAPYTDRTELKFGSPEVLNEAISDLIYGERYFQILQEAGISCTSLSYALFESLGAVWLSPA